MSRDQLLAVLATFRHREVPDGYRILSPSAEVAALLREHTVERESAARVRQENERVWEEWAARVTVIAFLFDDAVARFEDRLKDAGLAKVHRELRVLKGQLRQAVDDAGFAWEDPTGRPFDGPVVEQVHVDGWTYSDRYAQPSVAQVREPVVLRRGVLVREGSVTVEAPREEPATEQDPGDEQLPRRES